MAPCSTGTPEAWGRRVHHGRLVQLAREGAATTVARLRGLEPTRRHAPLVAAVTEGAATPADRALDLHARVIGPAFKKARRKHLEQFERAAKQVNEKVGLYARVGRAVLEARERGSDLLEAIESVLTWGELEASVKEAEGLARPHGFGGGGIDRRFYELRALAELSNALRSGDLWVGGSRQFRDFESYLLPAGEFREFRELRGQGLPLAVEEELPAYLEDRTDRLDRALREVDRLARQGGLPDAAVGHGALRIKPLENATPPEADALARRAYALVPRVKVTDLLVEVDGWCGFSRRFTHLKSDRPADDPSLLLAAVLADGINLGTAKMADACPGVTAARLDWTGQWHVREETYARAPAEVVDHQRRLGFAGHWGGGTTSSSDGQRFATGGRGNVEGQVNARYGREPGVLFYTRVSDQYAPFRTQVINATARDATHVLGGLLYHESDLRIEEHYTDAAGFTDHAFALCHLLGFRFAPRIRDLADKRLYTPAEASAYPTIEPLVAAKIDARLIVGHWGEVLRLAVSIRQGTTTASLMLRKLGSYPRQNRLASALRELGRWERTMFMLDYLRDVGLRRRIQAGLNKGEARNSLRRAVFFNRLGELRDRTYENQSYRASGLNLVVACIVLWNTVYVGRAINVLRQRGQVVDESLLARRSPLAWEHVNLTGDYAWRSDAGIRGGQFRPLRSYTGGNATEP